MAPSPPPAKVPPPSITPLVIARFSPYHGAPGAHGLELRGPLPYYALLHPADADTLGELACAFELLDFKIPACPCASPGSIGTEPAGKGALWRHHDDQ